MVDLVIPRPELMAPSHIAKAHAATKAMRAMPEISASAESMASAAAADEQPASVDVGRSGIAVIAGQCPGAAVVLGKCRDACQSCHQQECPERIICFSHHPCTFC